MPGRGGVGVLPEAASAGPVAAVVCLAVPLLLFTPGASFP